MSLSNSMHSGGDRGRDPRDDVIAAALLFIAWLTTLIFGLLSEGYHHVDDLTHFLFAKWAWQWPKYLLHDWGRPGFTALYFLPAWFGWHAARAWSATLAAATAWIAYRIACRLGLKRAWLVIIFLYVQPRFFTLALTTLTETPTGLCLALAVLLILNKRWSLAAAVYSVALMARHEAVVLLPVFALAAIESRQQLLRLWPIIWAPLLVNLLAKIAGMEPSVALFLKPHATGIYGRGGWYEFLCRSLEAFGPAVAALGIAGLWTLRKRRAGGALVFNLIAVYFLAQTIVRMFGLYDSGGYARFLVPIAPLWAIAAVAAWNLLTHSDGRRRVRAALGVTAALVLLWFSMELEIRYYPNQAAEIENLYQAKLALRCATAAMVLITIAIWLSAGPRRGSTGPSTLPLRLTLIGLGLLALYAISGILRPGPQEIVMEEELNWIYQNGYDRRPIVDSHLWLDYRRSVALSPDRPGFGLRIDNAPIGAIVIWDSKFSPYDQSPVLRDDLTVRTRAFRLLHVARSLGDQSPAFYIFEKLIEGPILHPSGSK